MSEAPRVGRARRGEKVSGEHQAAPERSGRVSARGSVIVICEPQKQLKKSSRDRVRGVHRGAAGF